MFEMLCLPIWVLFMTLRFPLKLWKTYFCLSKMSRLLFCLISASEKQLKYKVILFPMGSQSLFILGRRSYVILWFIGLPFPRRLVLDLYQQCRPWGRINSSIEDRRLQTCFRQQKGRDVSAVPWLSLIHSNTNFAVENEDFFHPEEKADGCLGFVCPIISVWTTMYSSGMNQ